VSTELQEIEGVDTARTALDEVRATQDECNEFFGGVFDQLQSLSLELFARHKCLEANSGRKSSSDASLVACRDELRRATEQIERLAENVESQLTRLTGLVKDIAAGRADAAADTQIAAILEGMRWQQADWLQQRAALETEVETLRSHAADQAEALHEQKRQASRQQAELSGELKRMRSLLETLTAQLRGDPPMPAGTPADGKRPPVDAFMLSSVLAQYQMLQRDGGLRNGKRSAEAGPPTVVPDATET
jgi:DNA repair exonuclease SbcCD ATPase subunit